MNEIKLGGKTRTISYNINALIEFEELTGVDLMDSLDARKLNKLKNIRALAFAGLKHGAKAAGKEVDFTVDDVGTWISFNDDTITEIMNAYRKDQPAQTEGEPAPETEKN